MAAKQVHIYGRDADDTLEWIQEKEGIVSSEDFGHDLESAQALVGKHEIMEVNTVPSQLNNTSVNNQLNNTSP